jgi:3-isopropylmalate/(R)-2-methylmalate dehydratase small subunit
MQPIRALRSRTVVLPAANIDTDQIIPARFLTTTTRAGLGQHLFADWRYDAHGAPQAEFILNRPAALGCHILIAGRNFGCGSSREHAPWALLDYGFRAVISTQIADIFRTNSLKNGFVPVVVDAPTSDWLFAHPGAEVNIDLPSATLTLPTGAQVVFPLETFARYCLVNGIDELGFLLERETQIEAFERRRPAA